MNPFLEMALSSNDNFDLLTDGVPPAAQDAIAILDKPLSGKTINTPTLIIFPAADFMDLQLQRVWAAPMNVTFHPGHPATRNAHFRQFRAARILQTTTPPGFQVLASAEGVPVILAGTWNRQKTVIWNFDPEDDNIFLDPAFPILLRDTVSWLSRSEEVRIESPGCPDDMSGTPACAAAIRQGGTINIPDLTDLQQYAAGPESENRKDLGRIFLTIALFGLLLLAAERISTRGKAS
jgi:hypothetical protein